MGAENRTVKSLAWATGSERGSCRSLRWTWNESRSGHALGLLPFETLRQAADLDVEEAWLEDAFIFCVDEG
jgi:hypothetical protein